jgi:hypothetical protein
MAMDDGNKSVLPLPYELREFVDDKLEPNVAIILQCPKHIRRAIELNLGIV